MIPRDATFCSPQSRSTFGVFFKAAALEGCRLALPVCLNYGPGGVTAYDCLIVQHFRCCSLFVFVFPRQGLTTKFWLSWFSLLDQNGLKLIETACLCLQSAGVKGVSQYSGYISAPLRQDVLHLTTVQGRTLEMEHR